MQFIDSVIDSVPNLSIITQIALLCWKTDNTIEKNVETFINDSLIFNINPEVINHCVTLRKKKKVSTRDAIIAATALTHKCTLVTNNEKDFTNIKGLKVVNPHKL